VSVSDAEPALADANCVETKTEQVISTDLNGASENGDKDKPVKQQYLAGPRDKRSDGLRNQSRKNEEAISISGSLTREEERAKFCGFAVKNRRLIPRRVKLALGILRKSEKREAPKPG
jgi:hypothetical protein